MATETRWKWIVIGLLFVAMWFACSAATVVPEARREHWLACNAIAFFAGGAFGAALLVRQAEN